MWRSDTDIDTADDTDTKTETETDSLASEAGGSDHETYIKNETPIPTLTLTPNRMLTLKLILTRIQARIFLTSY